MKLKIGEHIVYPAHGVGRVINVENKEIFGRKQTFITIQLISNNMKIMLPADNIEQVGLRKILPKKAIMNALNTVCLMLANPRTTTWNRAYREYMEKMNSGDFEQVCEVYKHLSITPGNLSFGERKLKELSKDLIVSEICLALDMHKNNAESLVRTYLTEEAS